MAASAHTVLASEAKQELDLELRAHAKVVCNLVDQLYCYGFADSADNDDRSIVLPPRITYSMES